MITFLEAATHVTTLLGGVVIGVVIARNIGRPALPRDRAEILAALAEARGDRRP